MPVYIVLSTTCGATKTLLCYYLHTMTNTASEVLIWKLLYYYYRQYCGDTQFHIVAGYIYYHLYHTIFYKCLHVMHYTIQLVAILNCAALFGTIYSLCNVPLFSTIQYCILRPNSLVCCTNMHDSHNVRFYSSLTITT